MVAPYVGAWIETSDERFYMTVIASHPTWVRGLKLAIGQHHLRIVLSHPTWVRGLKLNNVVRVPHCSRRTLRGCVD